MDTNLIVAGLALLAFGFAVLGYAIRGREDRKIHLSPDDFSTHHSRESIEQRARRVQ